MRALSRTGRFAAVLALVVLVGCKGQEQQQQAPPSDSAAASSNVEPPPLPLATPDVLVLLGDLKEGGTLGALQVTRVTAVSKGRVHILVSKGEQHGELSFVLKGEGPEPPATSDRYAVYYGEPRSFKNIPGPLLLDAATALANVLKKNEATAPVPAGLTKFLTEEGTPVSAPSGSAKAIPL